MSTRGAEVMLEPDLPPQRVLIVDDDKDARELLAEILGLDGIRCMTADSGEAAWDLLKTSSSIGLLITDLRMEPSNGLELIEKVRRCPSGRGRVLPSAFISAAARNACWRLCGSACRDSSRQ